MKSHEIVAEHTSAKPRISVLIPAHNEEEVIGESLRRLCEGMRGDEIEVLVLCNGCADGTVRAAEATGLGVRVLDLAIPSKTEAINSGFAECRGEHVIVMDADVSMGVQDVRALSNALDKPGVLAAAPSVRMDYLPGTSWAVRAYYKVWMSLPYVQEGMMAAGVWALNQSGRERVGRLPRIISDDGYVRLLFDSTERVEVPGSVSRVLAPLTLRDLVKIKTRSRLGWYELGTRFSNLLSREIGPRDYKAAWLPFLASPASWARFTVYLYVTLVARWRARRQSRTLAAYRWERDEGSRKAFRAEAAARQHGKD